MARNILNCAASISGETLSAWRDSMLPSAEMTRIHDHVPSCEACQQRLADFEIVAATLLRQREIEPGDRIIAGVRQRAAQSGYRPHGSARARRVWGGLGALAAVAAVVLLFVYVFGGIAGHPTTPLNGKTPVASTSSTRVPSPVATAPLAPVVSTAAAWGTQAETKVSGVLDATHYFNASGITPDGKYLLGYEVTLTSGGAIDQAVPAQAGLMNIATGRVTAMGVTANALYPTSCCITDGRFVLIAQDTAPGTTCGLCHLTYWSYDMTTGQKYQVARGTDYQVISHVYLSNGLLIMWTGDGAKVADLAARTTTTLAVIPASAQPEAFAWPYLLYSGPTGNSASLQLHLRDMSTGKDVALPQVDALNTSPASTSVSFALAGDTLFIATAPSDGATTNNSATAATTLYELDAAAQPGAQPRALARYNDALYVLSANSRLVIFASLAWDRAEHRFVRLASSSVPALSGDYLAIFEQGAAQTAPPTVIMFDTATLPIRSGG